MKMVVGLGNPGTKYRNTRHNLGFDVLDLVARRLGVALSTEKYRGLVAEARYEGERLYLLKPQTFMNLSGSSVAEAARNRIFEPADLLVVADDVNLPLGRLRMRTGGSAGGHNGLKSIIERLGTQDFPRLRLGVGLGEGARVLADHVLAKFRPEEWDEVNAMTERAADAVLKWSLTGAEKTMNEFN